MVTLISTGDRESDLYRWQTCKESTPTIQRIASIDCSTDKGTQQLVQRLESISLLANNEPVVAHFPTLTPKLLQLLQTCDDIVFLISPVGKLPASTAKIRVITEKVTDSQMKSSISQAFATLPISPLREDLIKIYLLLTSEDSIGKERISPLRTQTFVRQLRTLEETSTDEAKKLLEAMLNSTAGKSSQWELLDNLFSASRLKQKKYFSALTEIMSPYEIMSQAKATLLLVLIILTGQQQHLDSTSIATKIGKHPFYVGSIARTIANKNITYEKAYKLATRFFNLESALKSGKFDDEGFGFEVLLATGP